MMAYDYEDVVRSDTAEGILVSLRRNGQMYPRELAEKLDSHPSTISDILQTFRQSGLVMRGERTKGQNYKITSEGEKWLNKKQELGRIRRQLKSSLLVREKNSAEGDKQ